VIRAKFLQTIYIAKRHPKNGWGGEFAVITAAILSRVVIGTPMRWRPPSFAVFGLAMEVALGGRSGVLFIQSIKCFTFCNF
jgi:hypothetical protein